MKSEDIVAVAFFAYLLILVFGRDIIDLAKQWFEGRKK
jgi:hypothetical protein